MAHLVKPVPHQTVFFVCDIQSRFSQAYPLISPYSSDINVLKPFVVRIRECHSRFRRNGFHGQQDAEVRNDTRGPSRLHRAEPQRHLPSHYKLSRPSHLRCFPQALGFTVPELSSVPLGQLHLGTIDKTLFSMATPEVKSILEARSIKSIVLFGIEAHVCVLQSTLDLLQLGYDVYVLADGVSSCNKEEVPLALARMRQAGAQITTSESLLFQLQQDSSNPTFKAFSSAIKAEKETTQSAVQKLLTLRSAL